MIAYKWKLWRKVVGGQIVPKGGGYRVVVFEGEGCGTANELEGSRSLAEVVQGIAQHALVVGFHGKDAGLVAGVQRGRAGPTGWQQLGGKFLEHGMRANAQPHQQDDPIEDGVACAFYRFHQEGGSAHKVGHNPQQGHQRPHPAQIENENDEDEHQGNGRSPGECLHAWTGCCVHKANLAQRHGPVFDLRQKTQHESEPPAGVAYSTQPQNRLPGPKILLDVGAAFVKAVGKNAARSGLTVLPCIGCYNNAALSGLHRTLF